MSWLGWLLIGLSARTALVAVVPGLWGVGFLLRKRKP